MRRPLAMPERGGRQSRTEVLLAARLWRDDRPLWLACMSFHLGLLVVALVHLGLLPLSLRPPAGLAMVIGTLWLLARRAILPKVRRISAPSDYLLLLLLLGAAVSGLIGLEAHRWVGVLLLAVLPFSKLWHAPGVLRGGRDD